MTDFAVEVRSVSKRFRLYKERHKSIKERLVHPGRSEFTDLWAVNDVSFELVAGETVGILGHNGSGKSTLLKTVCGVLQPTSGEVRIRGKLAGLLELGAGFEPELSGRDNIYLNGSMLSIPKAEIDRLFDDIVAFSELGEHIDKQVKFYSSGMYVRLGFAVAVNVDPDVLVVDEVLAVGDERFQRKCMDRIKQFQEEGRTILFVSQSAEQVRSICDRVIVMHHGEMIYNGETGEGIRLFRERLNEDAPAPVAPSSGEPVPDEVVPVAKAVTVTEVSPTYLDEGRRTLNTGEALSVRIELDVASPIDDAVMVFELFNSSGDLLVRTDSSILEEVIDLREGHHSVCFDFDHFPFLDGDYRINVGVQSRRGGDLYAWVEGAALVEVTYHGRAAGIVEVPIKVRVAHHA